MTSKTQTTNVVYLLFDTTQFANSDDAAYELDYAFHGIYLSKESALDAFATRMHLDGNNNYDDLFDENGLILPTVKKLMEAQGWKILEENMPKRK